MIRTPNLRSGTAAIPWIVAALVCAALAWYAAQAVRMPGAAPADEQIPPAPTAWAQPPSFDDAAWDVFIQGQGRAPAATGPLSRRFRLAGTFFSFADPQQGAAESSCKAILDDVERKTQHLVGEGEAIEGVQVARIFRDHVLLRSAGREEELWLSFADASDRAGQGVDARGEAATVPEILEKSRYGTRVGAYRWVLNKDALMEYYNELREDPERIAHLFVSMKPDYREGAIAGYNVNMTGEHDFFKAAGLQEGDTVRKVNSLAMTSQARAEYFIGEFLQGRLNAVVMDIERDGKPQKLIYMIR